MVLPTRHTAVVSIHWSARKTGRLSLVNLSETQDASKGEGPSGYAVETRLCKLQQAGQLVVSPNSEYVATVDGQRVVVLCLKQGRAVMTMLHTRALTVRFHPSAVVAASYCTDGIEAIRPCLEAITCSRADGTVHLSAGATWASIAACVFHVGATVMSQHAFLVPRSQ